MEHLKYPIGKFNFDEEVHASQIQNLVNEIYSFPHDLQKIVVGLNENDLQKTYRSDGWNIKQLVHHLADSHMNAHIRFILALTENTPVIKPYQEQIVANLDFYKYTSIYVSLDVIKSIHLRWYSLLIHTSHQDLNREYLHPQYNKKYTLLKALANYVWHGKHHLAHVNLALSS